MGANPNGSNNKYRTTLIFDTESELKRVKPMEGRTLAEIPEFRLPRPSKEILDKETNLRVLEYARKAKSLRAELASDVVYKRKSGGTGGRHGKATMPARTPEIERAPERRNGER